MPDFMALQTEGGVVQGVAEQGFIAFKGIPYARAQRFLPPHSTSWEGVCDCTHFGKKAMQAYDRPLPWEQPASREEFDEDCLNLNIYVPQKGCGPFPVLMEIHGGAFQAGSNQENSPQVVVQDQPIIYVSINYRLGIWGFLDVSSVLGDAYRGSGNNGLLDILTAVRWVYRNIAQFGGDPQRITLIAGSAGAKALGALMLLPEFNEYVSQLILSSGGTQSVRTLQTAERSAEMFVQIAKRQCGEDWTPETLLTMTSDQLLAVQKIFTDRLGNTCMFGPVADDVVIPADWESVARAGTAWSGRAMIGCSRNEVSMLGAPGDPTPRTGEEMSAGLFGSNARFAIEKFRQLSQLHMDRFGAAPDVATHKQLWLRILSDFMYRYYSYQLSDRLAAKGCQVWQYSCEFLPAMHCFDHMLAFLKPNPMVFRGEERIQQAAQMGNMIHNSFLQFVCNDGLACSGADNRRFAPVLQDWYPLDPADPRIMYWGEECRVRQIPEDDVIRDFPESVYQL